jgi:integrase
VDGSPWNDKHDVALINVMARAGLRVSEALALKISDVELGTGSGILLVREGKRD